MYVLQDRRDGSETEQDGSVTEALRKQDGSKTERELVRRSETNRNELRQTPCWNQYESETEQDASEA